MAQETFIYNGDKIPIGGEIGQILTKVSGANYYCAWRNPPTAYLDESGVIAGVYGTNRSVPQITINASGIVTNAVNIAIDAPTVSGSGATGTWAISITGNAATATTLASGGTISFSSITGKPTTFSGYGISDTSANLAAAITDETGSGSLVFATSPTLSGVPLAPTASGGTSTTQIATTEFVTDGLYDDGTY